jgi:hypothetical protein
MVRMGTCFPAQSWESDARFGAGKWSLAVIGGSRSSGDGRNGRAGPFKYGTNVVDTAALAVVSIAVAPRGASSSVLFPLLLLLLPTSISTRAAGAVNSAGGLFSSLSW